MYIWNCNSEMTFLYFIKIRSSNLYVKATLSNFPVTFSFVFFFNLEIMLISGIFKLMGNLQFELCLIFLWSEMQFTWKETGVNSRVYRLIFFSWRADGSSSHVAISSAFLGAQSMTVMAAPCSV